MTTTVKEMIWNVFGGRYFSSHPGSYAGRGNNLGDLNSDILERLYGGIKQYFGDDAAKAMVNMVNRLTNLNDMSASTFLSNLYQLEESNWVLPERLMNEADTLANIAADELREGGEDRCALVVQVALVSAFARSSIVYETASDVSWHFLHKHRLEIIGPSAARQSLYVPRASLPSGG